MLEGKSSNAQGGRTHPATDLGREEGIPVSVATPHRGLAEVPLPTACQSSGFVSCMLDPALPNTFL